MTFEFVIVLRCFLCRLYLKSLKLSVLVQVGDFEVKLDFCHRGILCIMYGTPCKTAMFSFWIGVHQLYLLDWACFQLNLFWVNIYQPFLTLSQTTNFRLFRTESVCRQQFHLCWKWQKALQTDKKHCVLITSNFSFSLSVFKRFVLQTNKNRSLFGKEWRTLLDLFSRIFLMWKHHYLWVA